ncbi:hypothetical protein CC79DRAFT_1070866 [Sarocladium strictum]
MPMGVETLGTIVKESRPPSGQHPPFEGNDFVISGLFGVIRHFFSRHAKHVLYFRGWTASRTIEGAEGDVSLINFSLAFSTLYCAQIVVEFLLMTRAMIPVIRGIPNLPVLPFVAATQLTCDVHIAVTDVSTFNRLGIGGYCVITVVVGFFIFVFVAVLFVVVIITGLFVFIIVAEVIEPSLFKRVFVLFTDAGVIEVVGMGRAFGICRSRRIIRKVRASWCGVNVQYALESEPSHNTVGCVFRICNHVGADQANLVGAMCTRNLSEQLIVATTVRLGAT